MSHWRKVVAINDDIDEFEVECDLCGVTQSHDKDVTAGYQEDNGFMDMIQSLKDEGWKIYKSYMGEWNHLCPDCKD